MSTDSPMFTDDYQTKVLSLMLHNPDFCDVAKNHLKVEHFNNKILQWFYTTLAETNHHLTVITLQEELVKDAKGKAIKDDEVGEFVKTFGVVKERVIPAEQDYIRDKLGSFIKAQSIKRAMMDSVIDLTQQEKWDEIVTVVQEAVSVGFDLEDLGLNYFDSVVERVAERAMETHDRRIRTGIDGLDNLTYGGIKTGQVGMLVGATGRGKSLLLQQLGKSAILQGKKVVYFTFELAAEDIAARYDSMFTQVTPQELNDYQEEVVNEVNRHGQTYGKNLIIKHFPADSATVHTLKDFCRRLAHVGLAPDLILVDYIDLMRSHRTYNDVHAETDAITKALVGFAAEFDAAIWTATQMNRAGLVSETPDEASMAGYIGKQYHVDIVLWIAQTREEREDEIVRLMLSKNRNGRVGTINIGTNFKNMTFYDHDIEKKEEKEEETSGTTLSNRENNMRLLRDEIQSEPPDSPA